MIDFDKVFGFTRWRIVALALNLLGNALALYAALRFIRYGSHVGMLVLGLGITIACIGLLARPDLRPVEADEAEQDP